jgi:hypothetical protein
VAEDETRRKRAERLRKQIDRLRSGEEESDEPLSPRDFADQAAREEMERQRRHSETGEEDAADEP